MGILSESVVTELRKRLAGLKGPVKLIVFTQDMECQFCRAARELVEQVATLSEKFSVTVYDFLKDTEKVNAYGIDKTPAIVVEGERDSGIRFFGLPSGYEFGSLLETVNIVSRNNAMLSPETLEILKPLDRPVHIQVFVTLTCPYCPIVVKTALRFAFAKEQIRADMVETTMFPHLASRYAVLSVPEVVINETFSFEGVLPEKQFAEQVMRAVQGGWGTAPERRWEEPSVALRTGVRAPESIAVGQAKQAGTPALLLTRSLLRGESRQGGAFSQFIPNLEVLRDEVVI